MYNTTFYLIFFRRKLYLCGMRKIFAVCFAVFALCASAKANDKILIINGHFFSEMPVSAAEITGFSSIKTPTGTSATLITIANPLPEAALKYELSAEDVPEAAELLRRAESAKIMSLSVASPTKSKIAVGDTFPDFTVTDIDGKTWSNADVKGRVMVLNLWFTGCGPCRAEMPELSQWKDEMPDVMFFSATYEDAATARPVLEKQGFNWTAIVNDKQFKEWIDETGYPLTVVVNRDGVIVHIEHGTSPVQREELKRIISAAR
jgi:thiol-disulfide isomerase/thioredoxin